MKEATSSDIRRLKFKQDQVSAEMARNERMEERETDASKLMLSYVKFLSEPTKISLFDHITRDANLGT